MKKTLKRTLIVALVLVLSLTLFSGCNSAKTGEEYLLAEYGMTLSAQSSVYNGESQPIYVEVDSALASGKEYSVTYTYEKDGTSYDEDQIIDVGTYKVQATIDDGGDETYLLESTVEITPATVSFVVSDMYIRTGSSATAATTVFANTSLLGSDTVSSVGLTWDVDNISSIAAMDSVSDGIAIGVLMTNSDNYTLSVTKGTLYVLSYSEYTAVGTLEVDINSVNAYNERFDELSYSENNSYISAALRILTAFTESSSYSEIQLNMLGSVDESTIQTNYNKAVARSTQGYDLTWEVEGDAEITAPDGQELLDAVIALNGWESYDYLTTTQMTVVDSDNEPVEVDKFYVSDGFVIDYYLRTSEDTYDTYEGEVKYSDYFYFAIQTFESDAYQISSISVRGKEIAYDSGTPVEITDSDSDYKGNTYMVYYQRVDATTLGEMGDGSSIEVIINTVEKYDVADLADATLDNANVSSVSIKSGYTTYYSSSDSSIETTPLVVGESYDLYVTLKDGFALSSVYMGDYEIDGSEFSSGKYSFTVEEGMFDVVAGGDVYIMVDTIKQYTVQILLDGKTIRYTDGTYETTDGSLTVEGLTVSGTTAYVLEGDDLYFTLSPEDDYVVTALTMNYSNGSDIDYSTGDQSSISIFDEISASGEFSIDFSDGSSLFKFDEDESIIQINVTYEPLFTFEVSSDDVDFTVNTAGEFVSDYGTISFVNTDLETMSNIASGENFAIYADLKDGYFITGIKVVTTSYTMSKGTSGTEGAVSDYVKDVILYNESYYFKGTNTSSSQYAANPTYADMIWFDASDYSSRVDAGDAISIEITFDTYYEIELEDDFYLATVSMADTNLYNLVDGNNTYKFFFGSQDSSSITLTTVFDENWSTYYSAQEDLDYITYWYECNNEELDYFTKKTFSSTPSNVSDTIKFEDLMDLVNPGDVVYIECIFDEEWD